MKKIIILFLLSVLLGSCAKSTATPTESLETGDLIFQDLDCPKLCDAIEKVTTEQFGVNGPSLSHVGIVVIKDDRPYVFEAYASVEITPYSTFISRKQNSPALIRRMKLSKHKQRRLVDATNQYLGKPYDENFIIGDKSYYCSELVYEIFNYVLGKKSPIELHPMCYGKTGTAERKIWDYYFTKRNSTAPDGKPGVSPLSIWLDLSRYYSGIR